MSSTKIYLELSDEIQGILADNALSVEDILRHESIEATVTHGKPPYQSEVGARTKDMVTIILASGVVIPAIGFAIAQVLNAIQDKPYFVEYYENVELRNNKDEILIDKDGNPIFKTVKRHELIEPKKENQRREFEANFSLVNGVVIKFGTKELDSGEIIARDNQLNLKNTISSCYLQLSEAGLKNESVRC